MAQGLICSEVYIIFPGQGLNPGTLLWQVNSYPLAPPGTSYSSHSDRCIAISYCGLSCISLITNNEHPLSVCLYHILRIYVYEFWIFVGMTDAEAEAPIFWPSDAENWLIGKDPVAGKDWRQEEKGYDTFSSLRGWDGWMALLTQWTWVWASPRSWWWTGDPGVLQSMGSQRVRHDWVTDWNHYWHSLDFLDFSLTGHELCWVTDDDVPDKEWHCLLSSCIQCS